MKVIQLCKAFLNVTPALVLFMAGIGQSAEPPVPANAPEAGANATAPKIQFATPSYNFGRAISGQPVKYEYIFTNTGDAVLEITEVHPGCGCTTAGEWSKKVDPGKTGNIPIQFNSGGYNGPVSKSVSVTSNDKDHPTSVLQLGGTIWKPFDWSPQVAILNTTIETMADAKASVRIVSGEELPITLSDPESNNRIFAAELRTLEPGKQFELIVKTVPPVEAANAQGQITLKTSSTNMPVLNITAMTMLQPVVSAAPAQIALAAAPLAQPFSQVVTIRNNGTNTVALSEPVVNVPGVDVQLKETEPGHAFTVALAFPQGFEIPAGKGAELSVKSSHLQFPVVKVPISQAPRPVVIPSARGASPGSALIAPPAPAAK